MPSSTNPSPGNLKALALWGSVRGRLTTLGFFVRQDLVQRYQADILGMAWLVLQPLITIALFAVVFSALMRARLPGLDPTFGYTIYLIAGILAWTAFAQSMTRLSGWYRDRAGLYQKLALGLYLPPLSVVASEGVLYAMGMTIFALGLLLHGHGLSLHWLLLPVLLALLAVITFCLGLSLGLLEVFIPDIRRAVPIALQLGFWLTPHRVHARHSSELGSPLNRSQPSNACAWCCSGHCGVSTDAKLALAAAFGASRGYKPGGSGLAWPAASKGSARCTLSAACNLRRARLFCRLKALPSRLPSTQGLWTVLKRRSSKALTTAPIPR